VTITDELAEKHLQVLTFDTVLRRFGVEILDMDSQSSTAVMSMPVAGLANPVTKLPAVGPLAILCDVAAGSAGHFGCGADRWSVTSELSMDLRPETTGKLLATTDEPVMATAHSLPADPGSSLAVCSLSCGDTPIGHAVVRGFFFPRPALIINDGSDPLMVSPRPILANLMAMHAEKTGDGTVLLVQRRDPMLHNRIGAFHGGVAGAALEIAGSAAIHASSPGMYTASLRVNYLRPFITGDGSHYVARTLRVGRRTAVADVQAIGTDGRPAVTARVSTYR